MPKSGVSGFSGRLILNFWVTTLISTNLYSHKKWRSVPLIPHPRQHELLLLLFILDFLSDRYATQPEKGIGELTEIEMTTTGQRGTTIGSVHVLWLLACSFVGLVTVGAGMSLTLLPVLGGLFHLLGYHDQPWCKDFCLVLCVLFSCCFLEAWSWSETEEIWIWRKG